jgi:hypothetical protein
MKKLVLGLGALGLAAGLAVAPQALAGTTQSTDTEIEVNVDSSLQISSDGKIVINVMPVSSPGALGTGIDHVKVSTNSGDGYSLFIKDKDAITSLVSLTTDTPIVAGSGVFGIPAALGDDAWGYRVDTMGAGYAGITASDVEIHKTAGAVTNDVTLVTFGVNVTGATTDGVYSDVITYTAINAS